MVIRSVSGERTLAAEDYFVGPANDILSTTALRTGEILTSVRIPNTWANASFYFEKVADRNVWDFSLVNIAAAFKVSVVLWKIPASFVEPCSVHHVA